MRRIPGTPRCTKAEVGKAADGLSWVLCGCGWHMSALASSNAARRQHSLHVRRVRDSARADA